MQPTVGPGVGFGHLDSLVDEIKKKESDRVKVKQLINAGRAKRPPRTPVNPELLLCCCDRNSVESAGKLGG